MYKQPHHSTTFYKCTPIQDLWFGVTGSDYVGGY